LAKKLNLSELLKSLLFRLVPAGVLLICLLLHLFLPNKQALAVTNSYKSVLLFAIFVYIILTFLSLFLKNFGKTLEKKVFFLIAFFCFFAIWDLVTLKFKLLPLPYFPGPDKVLYGFVIDWPLLLKCTLYSLRLLFCGYAFGATLGLVTGTLLGWSQKWNYWIGPVLKIIGPIPATAWMPIALVAFPSSFWASVFLIALAVWFPVTVMTSSGIANVRNAFFEVAKTLGGDRNYLVFKVAIPAAMPNIFIGLFMGMGTSFLTLITAEMLGVKAGLGWYINWAQGWAEYNKVYTSLIVIAILFSSIITLLFKIKDRLLIWQKGLIKW
jgi:NitT/TauT family transport system permease protein